MITASNPTVLKIISIIKGGSLWFRLFVLLFLYVVIRLLLRPKRRDFDSMDGNDFEAYCAEVLKKNGYTKVRMTEVKGDHGIDILADKDGERYAIQCKCYEGKVGNKAVQEAYSGCDIYEADHAVVLTNSYFTPQAEEDAERLQVLLWDRNDLLYLIQHGN